MIINNTTLKLAIISNLDNFDKKIQLDLVLLKEQLTSIIKNVDIAIIVADAYYATCNLKKA